MNNILNEAMEKIKTFFSGVVTPEEVTALKEWVKMADMPPAETPAEPAAEEAASTKEVKTKDGKILSIEGDLIVGASIKEVTPEGQVDLTDGDYVLVDDANVELPIKVSGGKISEIATPQAEEPVQAQAAPVVAPVAQLSSQVETSLKAELADLKKQVVLLSNHLTKILETPINTVVKKKEPLTPLQQFRATK